MGIVARKDSSIWGVEKRSWKGVWITPGATAFTRMFSSASSFARPRVAVLAFCREVVPLMRAKGQGGSIINVSSVAARHGGGPGAYLYAGAKGFVSTATRGLAKDLAPDRIRVNAVSPGVIQTPFHDRFSTPQLLESFKAGIPMARLGEPDDCVGAFLYLASPQLSGYVTGQILEVNGGQYMP